MTCIIGYLDRKTNDIFMGADSAGVQGHIVQKRADEKVFAKNGMVFGFTGSFRMGQILRYSFDVPKKSKKESDYKYLCDTFMDSLIDCFREKGSIITSNTEVSSSGSFLIGYNGSLYVVDSDFQVGNVITNFNSVGLAHEIALGAMSVLDQLGEILPAEKVFAGLYTTTEFSSAVSKPFVVLRLTSTGELYQIRDPFSALGFHLRRTNNKLETSK